MDIGSHIERDELLVLVTDEITPNQTSARHVPAEKNLAENNLHLSRVFYLEEKSENVFIRKPYNQQFA